MLKSYIQINKEFNADFKFSKSGMKDELSKLINSNDKGVAIIKPTEYFSLKTVIKNNETQNKNIAISYKEKLEFLKLVY